MCSPSIVRGGKIGRMNSKRMSISVIVLAIVVSSSQRGFAEEVEHDVCKCKTVQVGAESRLKGGTCVRTETTNCLMEWGAGSNQNVPQGNQLSQQKAEVKAAAELSSGIAKKLNIPLLTSKPDIDTPLHIAIANLSRVPPERYGEAGMAESFVLAASTALARFTEPLLVLGKELLGPRRKDFAAALQQRHKVFVTALRPFRQKGSLTDGKFAVWAVRGCLEIASSADNVRIFVRTPFAKPETC